MMATSSEHNLVLWERRPRARIHHIMEKFPICKNRSVYLYLYDAPSMYQYRPILDEITAHTNLHHRICFRITWRRKRGGSPRILLSFRPNELSHIYVYHLNMKRKCIQRSWVRNKLHYRKVSNTHTHIHDEYEWFIWYECMSTLFPQMLYEP